MAPDFFQKFAEGVTNQLVGTDPKNPAGVAKAIQTVLGAPGIEGKGGLVQDIALAIIVPIIVAELTFVGIRIVLKSPFVDQFTQFTRTLFIAAIIIVWQVPQAAIRMAEPELEKGGKELGQQIIQAAGKQVSDGEPVKYWGDWLGDVKNDGEKAKYHVKFIMKMFQEQPPPDAPASLKQQYDSYFKMDGDKLRELLRQMGSATAGQTDALLTNARAMGFTMDVLIGLLMPFMVLSMILTATMAQMAGYIAPVFTYLTILIGSKVVLEFVLAVGLVLMPLMFFQTFRTIWVNYLTFCTGVALIPCFFYILSGIGFAFSTLAFDVFFPEVADSGGGGGGPGLAVAFKILLKEGLADNILSYAGWLGDKFNSYGLWIFLWLVGVFEKLFFWVGGTVIITTFVAGGVGFGSIATAVAASWNQAFSNSGMIEKINEFFTGIQGSVGSAVGQAYGQAMSTGSNMLGGAYQGAKNLMR